MEETHSITIKHMVCPRCVTTVKAIAASVGMELKSVSLGEVQTSSAPTEEQLQAFSEKLEESGFAIVVSKERKLINKIKSRILRRIHFSDSCPPSKLSVYLAEELKHDYSYLSKVFSSVEALTIERYFMLQRIERAKELLSYDELNVRRLQSSSTSAARRTFRLSSSRRRECLPASLRKRSVLIGAPSTPFEGQSRIS